MPKIIFHVGVVGIKPLKEQIILKLIQIIKQGRKIENTSFHLKHHDLIYSSDQRVKILQLRYWNEITTISLTEKKNDIRHGNAQNLSILKLTFLKKLLDQIKKKKIVLSSNQLDTSKPDRFRTSNS